MQETRRGFFAKLFGGAAAATLLPRIDPDFDVGAAALASADSDFAQCRRDGVTDNQHRFGGTECRFNGIQDSARRLAHRRLMESESNPGFMTPGMFFLDPTFHA